MSIALKLNKYLNSFFKLDLKEADKDYKYDARLMILTSHNNPQKEIKFNDLFPISLSSIEFNAQSTDIEYVQAQVTFKYSYFEIIE